MLNFFRKSPSYVDREFSDLSTMLCRDRDSPIRQRGLPDESKLDFSLESLKHIDAYPEALHGSPPQNEDETARVVLRCGAYVGEVIRKGSPDKMRWVAFKEAARYSAFAKGSGYSAATVGILWKTQETHGRGY